MRNFIITTILVLGMPFISQAALKIPKGTPLQPLPVNTTANVKDNLNTPGNSYNNAQGQIQNQQPDQSGEVSQNPNPEVNATAAITATQSNPIFYWVLILVASACLLIMIGYLVYHYRK
jgi:hypothetical protein